MPNVRRGSYERRTTQDGPSAEDRLELEKLKASLSMLRYQHEEKRKSVDAQTTTSYESRFIPKVIAENRFSIEKDHFKKYQEQYLLKKKLLEIQILRENKNQELLQKVLKENSFDESRKIVREQAKKAIQNGKRF